MSTGACARNPVAPRVTSGEMNGQTKRERVCVHHPVSVEASYRWTGDVDDVLAASTARLSEADNEHSDTSSR